MPLGPLSKGMMMAGNAITSATSWVQGLFTDMPSFSPEESLLNAPNIDPKLRPRAPMSADGIDVGTLGMLSRMGLKRGKLITAQSHPELYEAWQAMAVRAGLRQTPQLILTESKQINAFSITPEEAVVTTGILKYLSAREVMAILGHEMAHTVSNHTAPRMLAAITLGGLGMILGGRYGYKNNLEYSQSTLRTNAGFFEKAWHWVFSGNTGQTVSTGIGAIVGTDIGMIAANQLTVRPTELDADRKGAMISGDPDGLISALTKMGHHEQRLPAPLRWLSYLTSGYPAIETRIRAIRETAAQTPLQPLMIAPAIPDITPPVSNLITTQPGHQVASIAPEKTRIGTPVVAPHAAV